MAFQDTNPDRRNLVLISLAIIVFHFGGGSFQNNEIRLIVINAHFSNPEFLKHFTFIVFFWSYWRFWLSNKGKYKYEINKLVARFKDNPTIKNRIEEKIRQQLDSDIFYLGAIHYKYSVLEAVINCNDVNSKAFKKLPIKLQDEIYNVNEKSISPLRFNIYGVREIAYCLYHELKWMFTTPHFSNHKIPYLLAVLALYTMVGTI